MTQFCIQIDNRVILPNFCTWNEILSIVPTVSDFDHDHFIIKSLFLCLEVC